MPKTKMPEITLEEFAEILRREKLRGQFVPGLIVRKTVKSPTIDKIVAKLPPCSVVTIKKGQKPKALLTALKQPFERGQWLVFHLSDGSLPPVWREQLSRLRDSNAVFIQGKTAADTFFANQPETMRAVAVIDKKNLAGIDYPEFYNLFGPIIEI